MRQRVNDLGLGTWFQPSVDVQRRGATAERLGDDPVIQRGDVLHCDFGITALRLNTDTQHMGYVLREGETAPPAGLENALANSNRLQDIVVGEAARRGAPATRCSRRREGRKDRRHDVHAPDRHARPRGGAADRPVGLPGGRARARRRDGDPEHVVLVELQATTPVPEWNGQRVRLAQEEDFFMGADGRGDGRTSGRANFTSSGNG